MWIRGISGQLYLADDGSDWNGVKTSRLKDGGLVCVLVQIAHIHN